MALWDVVWMLIARSGKAQECGSKCQDPHVSNQVVIFVGNIEVVFLYCYKIGDNVVDG
jgi:hypothetical protein